LEFIDRLELIRLEDDLAANAADKDRKYALAFRDYGVDVDALSVEASVERLGARPAFAIPLAAALDHWVFFRRHDRERDEARWKRLVGVARGIDREPLRDQLRSSWVRPVSETEGELRRLAQTINVRAHHPATLYLLANTLFFSYPGLRSQILREGQSVYPGD